MVNDDEKIVHQIWFQGKDKIPKKYYKNLKKTKNTLKNWRHVIWDDESLQKELKQMGPKYINKYNNYKYLHQKVDYARYCLLYKYGGFYVDMDAYALKDPTYILKKFKSHNVFVSHVNLYYYESLLLNGTFNLVNNGVILARKNSEFMKELMENCPDTTWLNFNKTIEITNTTGPVVFSVLAKKSKKVKILSWDYFEPCVKNLCNETKNTIVVHNHSATWVNKDLNILLGFYLKNRETFRLIIDVLVVLILIQILKFLLKTNSSTD